MIALEESKIERVTVLSEINNLRPIELVGNTPNTVNTANTALVHGIYKEYEFSKICCNKKLMQIK